MLDAGAIARQLTDARAEPTLADAIADAVREAAEHGHHVTHEGLRAELAAREARPTRRFAGAILAQTVAIVGAGRGDPPTAGNMTDTHGPLAPAPPTALVRLPAPEAFPDEYASHRYPAETPAERRPRRDRP